MSEDAVEQYLADQIDELPIMWVGDDLPKEGVARYIAQYVFDSLDKYMDGI